MAAEYELPPMEGGKSDPPSERVEWIWPPDTDAAKLAMWPNLLYALTRLEEFAERQECECVKSDVLGFQCALCEARETLAEARKLQ